MDIKIFAIQSSMVKEDFQKDDFLKEIEKEIGINFEILKADEMPDDDFRLVYVSSGGSEGAFAKAFHMFENKPIYLLSKGEGNSLAASMEILSFIKNKGGKGEILHGEPKDISERIESLAKASAAIKKLKGIKIGLIGKPSNWLISSIYDEKSLADKLNMQIIEISMEELLEEISKKSYVDNEFTKQLFSLEYDEKEIIKALEVYGAFARIVNKYHLSGISVRCFDLLSTVETTGCLGLAILNALNIYAGCEGDIPSLISMCILGAVSQKPVFMCNPSRINYSQGSMVFAHCTLPINMPYKMDLMTHFESDIGVAIAGSIQEGACTIFKTSGDLSRHFEASGTIRRNLKENTLCRTQIEVELSDFSYFTENPIGNHHIICIGDETPALRDFFSILEQDINY